MPWLFQFQPEEMLAVLLKLLLACVLGGIIGIEREFTSHKPAGFRTHILVCLGSAIVMTTADFAMKAYPDLPVDPTRIGAQVVSGIGFLGAGAIIRHGFAVKGLTTAASLWAVACVGLACGIGFWFGAICATALVWSILTVLKSLEARRRSQDGFQEIGIEGTRLAAIMPDVVRIVAEEGGMLRDLRIMNDEEGGGRQIVRCAFGTEPKAEAEVAARILERIDGLPGVTGIFS